MAVKRRVTRSRAAVKRVRIDESAVEQPVRSNYGLSGDPPAWAEFRTDLCDALPWFRAVQGGAYHDKGLCFGWLLDADSGPRTYIDDEIVITRVGGGCEKDDSGNLVLRKDHDETNRALKSIIGSKEAGLAVGLIIGNRCPALGVQLPHRYNVMDFFRVTHIWFEKVGKRSGARIRFQKLDLEKKSWWASASSPDPLPLDQRKFFQLESEICKLCSFSSCRIYAQGWMCLNPQCRAFWELDGRPPPEQLTFDPAFLKAREPPDENVRPQYSLVPDLLSTLELSPDAAFSRVAWKGIVCPDCHKCIARKRWEGWICHDPLDGNDDGSSVTHCSFARTFRLPVASLRSVLTDLEIGAIQRAIRLDPKGIIPVREVSRTYQKFTYHIPNIGTVTHFSANREVLNRPNGPNDLFRDLQLVNLGLRRYPLKQSVVAGTLTSHFAVNYGMPYKYVVSVDSKGFDEAPPVIMKALGRLTWATKQAVCATGDEFVPPNELLILAYFEDMSIGYHDDGESSLGPTIATLSLGSKSTMRIRLKDKYFRGCSAAKKLLPEDSVLPGCERASERITLKAQYQSGKISKKEYDAQRLSLISSIRRKEGDPIISLDLHHGDLVVMHGADMQKYYEHAVKPENKLRFAITSRYVRPDHVPEEDRHKGNFTLGPDQTYDGQ